MIFSKRSIPDNLQISIKDVNLEVTKFLGILFGISSGLKWKAQVLAVHKNCKNSAIMIKIRSKLSSDTLQKFYHI